jgi:hypothetical protein
MLRTRQMSILYVNPPIGSTNTAVRSTALYPEPLQSHFLQVHTPKRDRTNRFHLLIYLCTCTGRTSKKSALKYYYRSWEAPSLAVKDALYPYSLLDVVQYTVSINHTRYRPGPVVIGNKTNGHPLLVLKSKKIDVYFWVPGTGAAKKSLSTTVWVIFKVALYVVLVRVSAQVPYYLERGIICITSILKMTPYGYSSPFKISCDLRHIQCSLEMIYSTIYVVPLFIY